MDKETNQQHIAPWFLQRGQRGRADFLRFLIHPLGCKWPSLFFFILPLSSWFGCKDLLRPEKGGTLVPFAACEVLASELAVYTGVVLNPGCTLEWPEAWPPPDKLNQNHWNWDPAIGVFKSSLSDSVMQWGWELLAKSTMDSSKKSQGWVQKVESDL